MNLGLGKRENWWRRSGRGEGNEMGVKDGREPPYKLALQKEENKMVDIVMMMIYY